MTNEQDVRLSHLDIGDGRPPKYINYRDLSVQQLDSVYERILEHGLKVEQDRVVVAENPAARKSSGSYYTPEELVALIIDRAVGSLVSERIGAFTAKATALASDTRTKEARLADLLTLDPASRAPISNTVPTSNGHLTQCSSEGRFSPFGPLRHY
jgi:hypothetical protein